MTKVKNLFPKRFLKRRRMISASISMMAVYLALPTVILSQNATSSIENIQAVFIYHFTQYVKWEGPDISGPFEIAVIGNSAIIDPLKTIAEKRTVDRRTIRIRQISQIEEFDSAQILFIPRSEKNDLDAIIPHIREGVLVVSEIEGAINRGVMISFVLFEGKIRFEINLRTMKIAQLSPSSQLLKLATRVIE